MSSTATACASCRGPSPRRAIAPETAPASASGPTRATSAAGSAPPSSPTAAASRRTSSGLPPVAAWQAAARPPGVRAVALGEHRGGPVERERPRLDQCRGRRQRTWFRPPRREEQHRQGVDAVREEGDEAGRGRVGPLEVVDDEELRAGGGEVRDEPVEAMQRAEHRVGVAGGARTLRQQDRRGQRGRAAQRALARGLGHPPQPRLEQLPRDAPGVRRLELAAAGRRDGEATLRRGLADGLEQARLADARRPLDDDGAAAPGGGVAERRVEDGELGVPLVQPQHHGCGRL